MKLVRNVSQRIKTSTKYIVMATGASFRLHVITEDTDETQTGVFLYCISTLSHTGHRICDSVGWTHNSRALHFLWETWLTVKLEQGEIYKKHISLVTHITQSITFCCVGAVKLVVGLSNSSWQLEYGTKERKKRLSWKVLTLCCFHNLQQCKSLGFSAKKLPSLMSQSKESICKTKHY